MFRGKRKNQEFEGDPLIPIMNLVCMLIPLLLYSAVFVRFHTLSVKAPKHCSGDGCRGLEKETKDLNLVVMVTDKGFHIKVNPIYQKSWMSQAIAQGTSLPDIPKKEDAFDYARLGKKLLEIKKDHRNETKITLGAEDDISFDVLIKVMDFSRGSEDSPLFPSVVLTRGIV